MNDLSETLFKRIPYDPSICQLLRQRYLGKFRMPGQQSFQGSGMSQTGLVGRFAHGRSNQLKVDTNSIEPHFSIKEKSLQVSDKS